MGLIQFLFADCTKPIPDAENSNEDEFRSGIGITETATVVP